MSKTTKALLAILVYLVGFTYCLCIAWAGGLDFAVRGHNLALCLIMSTVFAGFGVAATVLFLDDM